MGRRIDGETVTKLGNFKEGTLVATKEITVYKNDPQLKDNFQIDICAYGSWWDETYATFEEVIERLIDLHFTQEEIEIIKDDKNWEEY